MLSTKTGVTCCPKCIPVVGEAGDTPTGRIANDEEFAAAIADVLGCSEGHAAMRQAARSYAQRCSWDAVFDRVVDAYPAARTQLL
jgi:hypothetical protein